MISISLRGDQSVIQRLLAIPERVRVNLLRKVTELAIRLELKVKQEKLSGQVLKVRTGALRRSIFHTVTQTTQSVIGKVASSNDVKYAGIHEFGGRTAPHRIEPRKAKVLAWPVGGGKMRFAKFVNHPGSQMPVRSFLRSSLRDMRAEITTGLKQATAMGLKA